MSDQLDQGVEYACPICNGYGDAVDGDYGSECGERKYRCQDCQAEWIAYFEMRYIGKELTDANLKCCCEKCEHEFYTDPKDMLCPDCGHENPRP